MYSKAHEYEYDYEYEYEYDYDYENIFSLRNISIFLCHLKIK